MYPGGGGHQTDRKCDCLGSQAGSCAYQGASPGWMRLAGRNQTKQTQGRGLGRGEET